ncbi:hypothetical protein AVEN_275127-1 [Araneus ventricosus]|uniref:Serine hydrolase domain-containing protein n=1 Tax=Araneus ventricosus TaxID=182803 RepID=A0A4Y2SW91_ARAVE|nr:hypothetical protein AVEN_275127-1 [Araneus ventricosus]
MAAPKKLKILCLHGYRQDAESFKDKIGGFRKSIKSIAELVFVNAPNEIPTESCVITTDEGTTELRGEFPYDFYFVVIIAGFRSIAKCHQYLYSKTINIQSLHIMGENDTCISKDRSEELIPLFKSSSVVYHDGGHFIPSKSSVKAEYLPFFKNMQNLNKGNS